MRFARDFSGFLVDAETIHEHGNYICPVCHHLAHWRKMSVDYRRPHFYHAEANEDCPLSVMGGKWTIREDEDISFNSGLPGGEEIIFPKRANPDLSRIPPELIKGPSVTKQIPDTIIKMRLSSLDLTQIDRTVALLCDFLREENAGTFLVIPLPAIIPRTPDSQAIHPRIHKRLVKIIGATPELVEALTRINISENVKLMVDVT